MTDKSARQLQKKIRELERVNRDLDSTNRDLASSNQILTDKNIQFLMPATQTKGIKKATSEFEAGKTDAVLQHVLTSSVAGKEPGEEFAPIIL